MNIFNDLTPQFLRYQTEYEQKALDVLRSGWYILGQEVSRFEQEFADYVGSKYAVGLASGLDALWISLKVLGIKAGDEVIVQSNTYIATVMSITMVGATPIFVEPDEFYNLDSNKIPEKITSKTKAIIVVHLYGQATRMDKVMALCEEYKLALVEDCAQSHGAKYNNQMTGSFGHIGCFSFYPSKNLGAFGDAGAITTNDAQLAEKIRIFRNYGSEKRYHNQVVGTNSRLDELQAGLLRIKLKHIQELEEERIIIANQFLSQIKHPLLKLPKVCQNCTHVWHLFVVYTKHRDALKEFLSTQGIDTLIHYPIPPHLSEAYQSLNYKVGDFPIAEDYAQHVLSIPLFNGMTQEQVQYVIEKINEFKP
jgi:dTDP-4-amino-4,6-dideoxygalactose transaminase